MTVFDIPKRLGAGHEEWRRHLRNDPCTYCPARRGGTVEHVTPKAYGGRQQGSANVVGSCRPCNEAKETTPLLLFLLDRLDA